MAGNLVPRTDGGSNLGTALKEYGKIFVKELAGTAATLYAKLASPAFTGVPTAPTAPGGTSTTQLATTKFVVDEIADNLAGSIVPENDGTANLGSASKEYNKVYAKELGGTVADLVAMKDTSVRGTAVSAGDTVTMPGIPAGMYLECTTAGTTGGTAPAISTPVSEGDTVTDGTATWTVRRAVCENDYSKTSFGTAVVNHLLGSTLASLVSTVSTDSLFTKLLKKALEAAGLQYSIGANGYICLGSLFGDLILQWGTASVQANNAKIVQIPLNVPNFSHHVNCTIDGLTLGTVSYQYINASNIYIKASIACTVRYTIITHL